MRLRTNTAINPQIIRTEELQIVSGQRETRSGICFPDPNDKDLSAKIQVLHEIDMEGNVTKRLRCPAHNQKIFSVKCALCLDSVICPQALVMDKFSKAPLQKPKKNLTKTREQQDICELKARHQKLKRELSMIRTNNQ